MPYPPEVEAMAREVTERAARKARSNGRPPDTAEHLAFPPEEPVYLELGFPMPSETDDPDSVRLRIYEADKCHVIAELRFSRADLGDMLAARGRSATIIRYDR